MDTHIRTLFTHDVHSRLLLVNEPDGAAAPRLFLGRTRQGNVWRFRAGLSPVLIRELEALCSEEPVSERHDPPKHFASYVALLRSLEPVKRTWMGPAYVFTENVESERPVVSITGSNADMLRGGFEGLLEEVSEQPPFVAIVEDGRAVSVCRSVRITDEAHEAGVETLPECRGRDYARHAVAAWARMVHWLGALALYSTSWENKASQRVAAKLKLLMYGSDFHVT